MKKICEVCKRVFEVKYSHNPNRFCSEHCKMSGIRRGIFGNKNYQWKGDDATYSAIHHWVDYHFIKSGRCDICKTDKEYTEWSNKSRQYKRNKNDWQEVCKSCHTIYDNMMKNKGIFKKSFSDRPSLGGVL